jgi:allophanate hydrolase subunit 2
MGYRLEGAPLACASSGSLPSLGVVAGAVQVPPDGSPILLMADAQTTGGYPIAGVVIRADLPLAAQLLPGDAVCFRQVSVGEAVEAWREQRGWLEGGVVDEDDDDRALGWAGALE